mmetsp:Transcript_23712/g.58773  ORF Transcript_23712/g.58773 Transcript_23712/m.58773 type:complete len:448 (-) Transcript_23712:306-1649(-)
MHGAGIKIHPTARSCTFCSRYFNDQDALISHMWEEHEELAVVEADSPVAGGGAGGGLAGLAAHGSERGNEATWGAGGNRGGGEWDGGSGGDGNRDGDRIGGGGDELGGHVGGKDGDGGQHNALVVVPAAAATAAAGAAVAAAAVAQQPPQAPGSDSRGGRWSGDHPTAAAAAAAAAATTIAAADERGTHTATQHAATAARPMFAPPPPQQQRRQQGYHEYSTALVPAGGGDDVENGNLVHQHAAPLYAGMDPGASSSELVLDKDLVMQMLDRLKKLEENKADMQTQISEQQSRIASLTAGVRAAQMSPFGSNARIKRIPIRGITPGYTPIVTFGRMVYLTGIVASQTVDQDVQGQTTQALEHMKILLVKAGTDHTHLLQVRIYLTDIRTIDHMMKAWEDFFTGLGIPEKERPSRITQQATLKDPGYRVEVHAEAVLPVQELAELDAA